MYLLFVNAEVYVRTLCEYRLLCTYTLWMQMFMYLLFVNAYVYVPTLCECICSCTYSLWMQTFMHLLFVNADVCVLTLCECRRSCTYFLLMHVFPPHSFPGQHFSCFSHSSFWKHSFRKVLLAHISGRTLGILMGHLEKMVRNWNVFIFSKQNGKGYFSAKN